MISGDWEKRIKQTGLLELWGLGFIPIFAAVYGYWLHYGLHWPSIQPALDGDFSMLLFILHGYILAGVASAWLAPHRNSASIDYVSPRQRKMFAAVHVGICTIAMIVLLCVCP